MLEALEELQSQSRFSDFTVHLKEGPVPVSRILLAAMSPVFRKMLSHKMMESRDREVNLRHISIRHWECIVGFYLTKKKLVTVENVQELIALCDLYQLVRFKEFCSRYLVTCCCPENCIAIKKIALQFGLGEPGRAAGKIIAKNFSAICRSAELVSLDKEELVHILANEKIFSCEDDIVQALLAWMDAKAASAEDCVQLFEHVRLREVTGDCLGRHVLFHSVLARVKPIQVAVQDEMLRRLRVAGPAASHGCKKKYRQPSQKNSLMVVGRHPIRGFCMLFWSPVDGTWKSLPCPHKEVKWDFCAAVYEGSLVVTGGDNVRGTLFYDMKSRTWSAGPNMTHGRSCHSMVTMKNAVYVLGGDGVLPIERFTWEQEHWAHAGDLRVHAEECGVTVVGETILVVGGSTDESTNLIQTFNVITRRSAVLDTRLPHPMRHVRAASWGNTAFFVGEEGDLIEIKEVDGRFQITSHVMLVDFGARSWFGLEVTENCVTAIGSCGSVSVQCWNFQGEKQPQCDIAPLPMRMSVYATFHADVTGPSVTLTKESQEPSGFPKKMMEPPGGGSVF